MKQIEQVVRCNSFTLERLFLKHWKDLLYIAATDNRRMV